MSPTEAYAALADAWGLTPEERAKTRGGRRLYEHEIRWARQELVIKGFLQTSNAAGRAAWRLVDMGTDIGSQNADGALSRMIIGFLDPNGWFLSQWLPRYEQTVGAVRRAVTEGRFDASIDLVWRQKDNSVSNAGPRHVGDAGNHDSRIGTSFVSATFA